MGEKLSYQFYYSILSHLTIIITYKIFITQQIGQFINHQQLPTSYKQLIFSILNKMQQNNSHIQSQTLQQKVFILTFYHPKLINKTVPIRSSSFLYEFRSVVSDGTMLKLFENYQFTFNKQVLSQMTPLNLLLPESKQQIPKYAIDIRLVAYDQRTAKYHLKQVFEMITNPILYQLYQTYREQNKQILQEIQNRTLSIQSNILMDESFKINPNVADVLDFNISSDLLLPHFKVKKPQLIQFISLSGFNPPPPQQRLDGSLFYLHLRVLESVDYHITASPQGFYVNQSKISVFNPAPIPNKPTYASLFDLIRNLSQKFENKLEDFLAQNKLDDNDKFLLFFKTNHFYKWLQKVDQEHTWNSKKSMAFYLKQLTTSQLEDWNQSFHLTDKLPLQSVDDFQVFDTKHKLYKNFEQAAVDGATMLIDGKIAPLNPLQQKKKQIYIHNKIFFSIANETPYNHSQQKGQQAAPSSSAINTDLINLQILYNLGIKGLNVLHMVLINYRGYKIIAQCIIPGILSAEQNLCSQYGSIDDGKTIQTNPEFQKLMVEVANKLHLQDVVKVRDGNGVQKTIAISPDIKGILGSNQKKYILDLLRLSPRDMNYPSIENETCVLRPELIRAFKKSKNDKKQQIPKINVNIGTQIKFIQSDDTPRQKALLEEMAKYLLDQTIPSVINSLKNQGSTYLTNSQGISQAFHEHGLNLRYLGRVYNHSEINNHVHIKIFLERAILVRCLKHLFRMAMRQTNIMHMNMTLTRLLNCIFGQKKHLQILQGGSLKESQMEEDVNNKDGKKKKKKNKNNKEPLAVETKTKGENDVENLIKIEPSVFVTMRPSELWQVVKKLAKARYDFDIKGDLIQYNQKGIFSLPYTKLATLQDLCTVTGLTLQERQYSIVSSCQKQTFTLPFHYKNIVNITPRSKHMKYQIPKQKQLLEAANQATEKYKIKEALQNYNSLLEIYTAINDAESMCDVYSKLGKIFYHMTDYQQAIAREISVLKIFQMGLRPMNHKIVQSYSKLGLYEMVIGHRSRALYFLHKSLMLMLINYGETYPDILVTLANIARIYQQDKEYNNAVNCYLKALDLVKSVTSKYHINISFCYSSLASLHYEMKDIKKAIEYQTESVATLCKFIDTLGEIFDDKDTRLSDAKTILKVYHDLALQGSVYTPQQVPASKVSLKPESQNKNKK